MNELKQRNDKARCPVCHEPVCRGSSANWCPTFHYNAEHMRINGKDVLVAEFFQTEHFTLRVGYIDSIHAPRGTSILPHPKET